MKLISTQELIAKKLRGDHFKLVMTFPSWGYQAQHIPGSINIASEKEVGEKIRPEEEVIVYCINANCQASVRAYQLLHRQGFRSLRRYAGGVAAWEAAGQQLEGSKV